MLLQYLKIALLMIRAKPVRAVLSLLGIYIGVLALVVILCLREGVRRSIENIYKTRGAQIAFIYPGYDPVTQKAGMITRDDITHVASEPGILSVLPRLTEDKDIRSGGATLHVHAAGIDAGFGPIYQIPLIKGRFFIPSEITRRQPVCLLTQEAAEKLFPLSNPLGAILDVSGTSFEVVGVVRWDAQEAQRTTMEDPELLLPYTWLGGNPGGEDKQTEAKLEFISTLEVRLSPATPATAVNKIVLDAISRRDADRAKRYNVFTLEQFFQRRQENNERTKGSLLAIAAISLLVGTIGVANVMLTSVTERTREVGIRKAVGAGRHDILLQFLVESSVLSGAGGILAVLSGWIFVNLYPLFVKKSSGLAFPLRDVIACLVLTFVIGILAGVYPASHAAALSPAEALRYE